MKQIISVCYVKFIKFFKNKKSNGFLYFIAFIESIFFPIPTDPFLIPYILSRKKFYKLVFITTTYSVAGGIITYVLGGFFYQEVSGFLLDKSPKIVSSINNFSQKFEEIGYIIILIGGFSPFPFKITCFASGILGINFVSFIILSFISRFSRFFLVGYFISKYGDKAMNLIKNNTKKITWILLMLLIILILLNFSKF